MLDFLERIALSTGKIITDGINNIKQIDVKKNAGWVTDIDKKSEEFIIDEINKNFPNSSILAEESGESNKTNDLKWIIDPLDGTSNFAHGFPWYCVSIGVEINSIVQYGVIYQPILNELYLAEKGKGASLNKDKLNVSKTKKLDESLVATGFSYLRDELLAREVKRFSQVQQVALGVRRAGSAAMDLACVACGRFDGFWEFGLNPWDIAAGFLLIEEAGGKVSKYDGSPANIYDRSFVVSNSHIHEELVKIIQV